MHSSVLEEPLIDPGVLRPAARGLQSLSKILGALQKQHSIVKFPYPPLQTTLCNGLRCKLRHPEAQYPVHGSWPTPLDKSRHIEYR